MHLQQKQIKERLTLLIFVLLRAEITDTHVKFVFLRLQLESEIHCTLKLTSLWKAFALGSMTYLHLQDKYASIFKGIHYF